MPPCLPSAGRKRLSAKGAQDKSGRSRACRKRRHARRRESLQDRAGGTPSAGTPPVLPLFCGLQAASGKQGGKPGPALRAAERARGFDGACAGRRFPCPLQSRPSPLQERIALDALAESRRHPAEASGLFGFIPLPAENAAARPRLSGGSCAGHRNACLPGRDCAVEPFPPAVPDIPGMAVTPSPFMACREHPLPQPVQGTALQDAWTFPSASPPPEVSARRPRSLREPPPALAKPA